jgi:tRNA (guanine-N7-)-methyltransferase
MVLSCKVPDRPEHRPIRSFVRREGRLTPAQDRALLELLPRYQVQTDSSPLNFEEIFGNQNPVVLEIGFGNGTLLAEQAAQHPGYNFIGLEVHRPGVGRLLQQLDHQAISNVRIMNQDAIEILSTQISPASLFAIWLFFPDPWPKKRHHKRRIVNSRFLDHAANSLRPGGILQLATDWQDYAHHMRSTIKDHPRFSLTEKPEQHDYPFIRPPTHFEQRGQHRGHTITDLYAVVNNADTD